MNKKICPKCQRTYPLSSEFWRVDKKLKDGFSASCRTCINLAKRERYCEHKEIVLEQNRKWRERNIDACRAQQREYGAKNSETAVERTRRWRETNRDRRNEQERQRRKNDPTYNLIQRVYFRTSRALRGYIKAESTLELLDCTPAELRRHMEKHFLSGMSWENRRDWHVDHVVPVAFFDLNNVDHQAKCFHYTNLKPSWGKTNTAKQDKIGREWGNYEAAISMFGEKYLEKWLTSSLK